MEEWAENVEASASAFIMKLIKADLPFLACLPIRRWGSSWRAMAVIHNTKASITRLFLCV